ncbi:MAG TPA: metal ABC transporter ATP-binding protein [Dissulfurispiraceae bacterium]|nr:metal ABC transporter ATP-binding protein [Dissulfurispiraceae bacterium]
MPEQIICADRLCYRYNSADVINNISFDIAAGDYIGLVGPNGSGKSTLIRLILGLLVPTAGNLTLFGHPSIEMKCRERIGYLPQKLNFFNPFFPSTVREIVSLGLLSGRKLPKRLGLADIEKIGRILDILGISHLSDKAIGDLSGGQQQRVFIARALVNMPELLLLDEPTTALDPETRDNFFELMNRLNSERKVTIILVTHDTGSIGKYASKLLYIDKEVIFFGGFDEFCLSGDMTAFFGASSQHVICHRHDHEFLNLKSGNKTDSRQNME